MKLQDKIFGIDTREAYERVMREEDSGRKKKQEFQPLNIIANINGQDYIRIPESKIVISRNELHKGLDWNNTHYSLADNGLFMPTPALFMPYFINIRDAAQGKITLYTADNNPIPRDEAEDLWKYLSTGYKSGCWTWLDAQFKKVNGSWKIETNHKVNVTGNEKKLEGIVGPLEDCLREDGFVDLEFNSQGLPVRKSQNKNYAQGENIHYWHPRDGAVARFIASSDGSSLNCLGYPVNSCSALGVFSCAVGAPKK